MNYLFLKAQNGDKTAEDKIFKFLFVRFCYLAKQRVGEGACEDIAQDACLTILEKYPSLNGSVQFEPWAYQVLRNKIGNYYQKLASEANYIINDGKIVEFAHPKVTNPNLRMHILDCLRKIHKANPRYYQVLTLVSEGYKTEEISEKLQIKPNNLYVILNRSRKLLRDCLKS